MSTVQGGPNIVTDGLVFYVDAANQKSYPGTGTTVNNLTSNQINGTLNGVGFDGKSWTFDGTDDYISCDSLIPLIQSDTQGTIEAWVKPTDATPTPPNETIVGFGDGDAETRMNIVNVQDGTCALIYEIIGVNTWILKTNSIIFSDNTWTHVAIAQNGVSPYFVIDGIEYSESEGNATFITDVDRTKWLSGIPGVSNARIGCLNFVFAGNTNFYTGNIATTIYYNRALSSSEIQQNYNALKSRFI